GLAQRLQPGAERPAGRHRQRGVDGDDAGIGLDEIGIDEDALLAAGMEGDARTRGKLDRGHALSFSVAGPARPCRKLPDSFSWEEKMDDPFDGVTAFVQVAGAKSFTDAARRLGVTGSALSKTI